ncbi:protein inturned-like [Saccostrea cucullata]|uniref:protein inturned-like n=1 Tax=Saccostrea cuccullata TaxID=36930 RepID=UPI002ED2B8C3
MFGLQVPLSRAAEAEEFDSVSTILLNSAYNGPTAVDLSRCKNNDRLFVLELFGNKKHKCDYLHCPHNGHSTDDTGYGTDNDDVGGGQDSNPDYEPLDIVTHRCTDSSVDFTRMDSIRRVKLKVKKVNHQNFDIIDRNRKPGQLGRALCKELIGIIPGHFPSKSMTACGQRLCVRGLVPHSHASKYSKIQIGDCLRLINGREITWDNIDDVLLKISHLEEVSVVIQQVISKQPKVPVLTPLRATAVDQDLVQVISGQSLGSESSDPTPGHGVMFIDLQKLQSETEASQDDLVYQYPQMTLTDLRGALITLYHTAQEWSHTKLQQASYKHNGEKYNVTFYKEETTLLLLTFKQRQIPSTSVSKVMGDLLRLLRVLYNSVMDAFLDITRHGDLNCLFALFFHSLGLSKPHSEMLSRKLQTSLDTSLCCHIPYLPLLTTDTENIDKILTSWEAQEFSDVSESYFGCRRAFTILGSCLFYKSLLLCNHLPKEDLTDVYLYLKYHCLLSLCCRDNLQQLVVWQEVNSTRQMFDLGEEQVFGYTEPVNAKLIWLIVGYKRSILCTLLEIKGGAIKRNKTPRPDPMYIDQAKAVLLQINSLDLSQLSKKRGLSQRVRLVSSLESTRPSSQSNGVYPVTSSPKLDVSNLLNKGRQLPVLGRKDSVRSDGSMESNSSAGSDKTRNKRGRLFSDVIQEDKHRDFSFTMADKIKLTSGADNCLLHFLHFDKYEGVIISPEPVSDHTEIVQNFYRCSSQIKHMFDKYRYRRKSAPPLIPEMDTRVPHMVDTTFNFMREEGVMFTVPTPGGAASYWVVGRQRSKEELYVCFQDGTPQNLVELTFKTEFGLKC